MAEEILIPDYITVRELADMMQASPIDVMKKLIANGIMASINQQIDYDTASIIVEELGFIPKSSSEVASQEERRRAAESQTWRKVYTDERRENLQSRPPIVTILGHVDHGKTTLLDTIRKANVAAGEAGGITQHIGAYRAFHDGKQLTFLDTPGHEAFTAMRARGAQGADIAVMVVAADDGVMPTTREALNHVRAADVPFVVAVTKVDKPNANLELVKQGMSDLNVIPDEWGGEYMFVPVAATKGQGVDDLLEALILLAEERDIVANPKANPSGIVLEAQMDPNRGVIATLLILNGTLKRGDTVMIGNTYGRVKAMFDESGKPVKDAPPSTPVAVMGISDMPSPGDSFNWVDSEKTARKLNQERESNTVREEQRRRPTLEELFARFEAGDTKELILIVKADVQGSIQPIVEGLEKLSAQGGGTESITVRILSQETGNISENDVNLASSSGAIIIGFNVSVDNAAQRVAANLGVDIRIYNIIYKLFESIELALNGMLEPVYEDIVIGHAEVRAVYRISKIGTIAGSYILDGEARRNAHARILRKNQLILEKTGVSSLKRVNDDVKEVRSGFECGIGLANFSDFHEGDVIEFFVTQRVN